MLVQGSANKENAPNSGTVVRAPKGGTAVRAPTMKSPVSSNVFGSLFSNVHNCNITISPQNVSVNVHNGPTNAPSPSDFDVNALLDGIDLDTFLS